MRPSRIGLRLLAFNLLLVFLPVAGILYLDVYETALLELQERGMVQQGRLVAAALGEYAEVTQASAGALLARLGRRGDARIRVYDAGGTLMADSARLPEGALVDAGGEYATASKDPRARPLYRLGVWVIRVRRALGSLARTVLVPRRASSSSSDPAREPAIGPELRAALDGKYGADTRATPGQRSMTLHSAVPIRHGDRVIGATQVSQSTFRILQALYDVRLRIFQIVVASIIVAVVLGLLMSATIVRPLVRLRRAAIALSERRAAPSSFARVKRRDEIGDLARALEELTGRLDAHIKLLESFAGDVSHEFKNPLASIRVAAEMIAATEDPADRARLLGMLTRDVDRLERLVTGVRELARIDAQIAHEAVESIDLTRLLADFVEAFQLRDPRVTIAFSAPPGRVIVRAAPDRLAQVFENLLENAVSFAPAGSRVDASLTADAVSAVVTVTDSGPGIPDGHLERVFDRFFSYRPGDASPRDHMGLGLAIAKAIVEGYSGSITARNHEGGGTAIVVRLPLAEFQASSRSAQISSGVSTVS
jgi:two-component system sensor histidine kinase ChvG